MLRRRDLRVRRERSTDDDQVKVMVAIDGRRPLRRRQASHVHMYTDLAKLLLDDVCKRAMAVEEFHVVEREFTIGELVRHTCIGKKLPRLLWIVLRSFRL